MQHRVRLTPRQKHKRACMYMYILYYGNKLSGSFSTHHDTGGLGAGGKKKREKDKTKATNRIGWAYTGW